MFPIEHRVNIIIPEKVLQKVYQCSHGGLLRPSKVSFVGEYKTDSTNPAQTFPCQILFAAKERPIFANGVKIFQKWSSS